MQSNASLLNKWTKNINHGVPCAVQRRVAHCSHDAPGFSGAKREHV